MSPKKDFPWSNWRILYETRIETLYLRSFWGVDQLSSTSGSRDMNLVQFWEFWTKFCQKWDFLRSDWYILYETRIETVDLRSIWGVNQLTTVSGSRVMILVKCLEFWTNFGPKNVFCHSLNPINKPILKTAFLILSKHLSKPILEWSDHYPLPLLV